MTKHDLVIRGGTVVDGTGGEPFDADVAVKDGRIVEVGKVADAGAEEIDAKGHLVTPGFIDIHTHFDAQIMWDQHMTPCSEHGVTTVLMGNCGVGFAPCKPEHREVMVDVMDGVEDIPADVLNMGLPWTWQSFPEFMDVLATREADVDFGTFVPHVPIRVFVMGERGIRREPASPADIKQMAALVEDGIAAGGFGFTTSRATGHRARSGDVIPSTTADEDELMAMALALKRQGRGHFMSASEFHTDNGFSSEFNMLRRIAETSGRPVHFPLLQGGDAPEGWRIVADGAAEAARHGGTMRGQVVPRPVGVLFGLEMTNNPFTTCASYRAIAHLPLAERVAAMRDPALRARLLAEEPAQAEDRVVKMSRSAHMLYRMGDPPNYAPPLADRLDKIAESRGTTALDVAYDILLENDGRGALYLPARNYAYGNLDTCLEMLKLPETEIGLGDAGAHVGRICDSSMPTFLLTYWGRDRDGERLSLPWIVKALTADHAQFMGMPDRGLVKTGLKADLNVIDHGRLRLHTAHATHDLPGGGMRLAQHADGYVATVVSGHVTRRDGTWTGALPGRLVRAA
jgi:N-acyl-D-amino-acid deacylase